MAAANQKAQVQIAAAALHSFEAMCDSGTHLIPIHTLPDKQSAALLESCVVRGGKSWFVWACVRVFVVKGRF